MLGPHRRRPTSDPVRPSSSVGQSCGLLIRRSWVRAPRGAPPRTEDGGRGAPDSTAQPLAGRYRGALRHPLRAGHGHIGRVRLPDLPDTGDSETGHTPSCDFSLACSASRTRLICGGGGSWSLVAWVRVVICGLLDGLPPVCWPGSCACRSLRIRAVGTLCRAGPRAPDLRGHWVYKGEDGVGSVLVLRLRQNRPPTTAGVVHSTPGAGRGTPVRATAGGGWRAPPRPGHQSGRRGSHDLSRPGGGATAVPPSGRRVGSEGNRGLIDFRTVGIPRIPKANPAQAGIIPGPRSSPPYSVS